MLSILTYNSGAGPAAFLKVGYYESWNWDRPCLNYKPIELAVSDYTHIHWGFATIGSGFTVNINDTYKQLDDFLAIPGKKKIVSFGGWGYSTDPSTYQALRTAMDPANVDTFATNIVNYLNSKGFEGVDIDWEYPGVSHLGGCTSLQVTVATK